MKHLESELRRRLFKVVGAFFLTQTWPIGWASAARSSSAIDHRTFAVFLDVLLPRDSYSGSATDLGVDVELMSLVKQDARFSRLTELGCTWLNMTSRGDFADLSPADQFKIVDWMSRSDWNQIPRRFYELIRQTAIDAYFCNPASLAGLQINNSPQPLGYPPPWH